MPGKLVPFPVHETTLANGLRVIVVSTGFPNIVSLQIPVQTGSRNEVEPGKSGFAHFFEHMMFRGTDRWSTEAYGTVIAKAGARQNAYTTDDYTNYHITFAAEDLDAILELEADRFMNLNYSEEAFKTESRAILGEYNKSVANPVMKLFEVQRDHAYTTHTYKHTTMGFLRDIEDMPNQFAYSLAFFRRWYRPQYSTVILAGDLDPKETATLVARHFGRWQPGADTPPAIPREPDPTMPVVAHVPWPAPTLPWLSIGFHGPAFSTNDDDFAALDMLCDLWFGETSDLYRRLVEVEQKVDQFGPSVGLTQDPGLPSILARVKDPADGAEIRDLILATCARARGELVAANRLADAKSSNRYSLLRTFDNSETVAATLARFVRFNRSVSDLERLFEQYDALTPERLRTAANRHLTTERLVFTSLSHGDPIPGLTELPSVPAVAGAAPVVDEEGVVRSSSASSQLRFKIQFGVGSTRDPEGREGLAALAAEMIAEAGSRDLRIDEITRAYFPWAASFSAQVDREQTTFTGVVHTDNFDRFADIALAQLTSPGWREADFARLKDAQRNHLIQDLRSNNEEELGKEVLQGIVYAGTPYGHPTVGTVSGIDAITLEDVKSFASAHYTAANAVIGLSGAFDMAAEGRLKRAIASLPAGTAPGVPPAVAGRMPVGLDITLIEKETRSVAISFGHPINVLRGHEDFPALWLAKVALGEHRAFNGRLFHRIRELRGMNYGDYAYIEAFPGGMYRFFPEANRARRAQLFEVWVRPVPPEQARFALKLALHEVALFVSEGLSEEEFVQNRDYLLKNVYVMLQTQDAQLGYDLDSRWYGIPEFASYMREHVSELTRERVNHAIRRHLSAENLSVVMVCPDGGALREELLSPTPAVITYDAERPESLLAEDRAVGMRPLGLMPERVRVVKANEVFG